MLSTSQKSVSRGPFFEVEFESLQPATQSLSSPSVSLSLEGKTGMIDAKQSR